MNTTQKDITQHMITSHNHLFFPRKHLSLVHCRGVCKGFIEWRKKMTNKYKLTKLEIAIIITQLIPLMINSILAVYTLSIICILLNFIIILTIISTIILFILMRIFKFLISVDQDDTKESI